MERLWCGDKATGGTALEGMKNGNCTRETINSNISSTAFVKFTVGYNGTDMPISAYKIDFSLYHSSNFSIKFRLLCIIMRIANARFCVDKAACVYYNELIIIQGGLCSV